MRRKKSRIVVATAIVALAQALPVLVVLSAQSPQEKKPVPSDSVRVSVAGCSKGYVFTASHNMPDVVSSLDIPAGMHLRMNGPKKVIDAIGAYKESMIQITGIMKKGQYGPGGVAIGGVRIAPGPSPGAGGSFADPAASQVQIDVEGWSPVLGTCPAK
jgi:hypothetical protein